MQTLCSRRVSSSLDTRQNVGDIMKPLKEKISITIDSDLLEKLRIAAENDDRPLSQYINLVLKKHMEQMSK